MDAINNTIEIIKFIKKVYDKYSAYKASDKMIAEAHIRLGTTLTTLRLFEEYLRMSTESTPVSSDVELTIYHTLSALKSHADQLESILPQGTSVLTKIDWVTQTEARVKDSIARLRGWAEDASRLCMMLNMVKQCSERSRPLEPVDVSQSGFASAVELSKRILDMDTFDRNAKEEIEKLRLKSFISTYGKDTSDLTLGIYEQRTVLVEVHRFDRFVEEHSKQYQLDRALRFAWVFQSSDLPSIHLLPCLGHQTQDDSSRYVTVYELPTRLSKRLDPRQPQVPTLAHILQNSTRIAMEDRYRIAVNICDAVLAIHSAGWVHKSIRSDTILVAAAEESEDPKMPVRVDAAYLVGCQTIRPRLEMSTQYPEQDPIKRMYQHPERQGGVEGGMVKKFDIRHDMYSLGAVLLEIGYRKTLQDLFSTPDSTHLSPKGRENNHQRLLKHAHRVSDKMGTKYARATLACLERSTKMGVTVDKLREEFYGQVLCPLKEILGGMEVSGSI
ncbi:hypothetical protein EIP86_008638 [Pleurotus ostreatoroseus]|nr:hypothetical protein EIP86_008638 [Pleurotus ostreatoroseus]